MEYTIRAITEADVPGYHRCLDVVAREGRFLAFREAPPLERSLGFVRSQIESGTPMFVAVDRSQIVDCSASKQWRATQPSGAPLIECGTPHPERGSPEKKNDAPPQTLARHEESVAERH